LLALPILNYGKKEAMRSSSILLLFFVCNALNNWFLYSQDNEAFTNQSMAEKVYLQLDNDIYANDDTIWFKAIVLNAVSHNLNFNSNIMYVDLISFEEKIIESKIIKLKEGIGEGYFDLNIANPEGVYQIRAYTEWNKNFGGDFIYSQYIQIYRDSQYDIPYPIIGNFKRVDTTITYNVFEVDLYPDRIDSNHNSRSLKAFVEVDGKTDTIWLNRSKDLKFIMNFSVHRNVNAIKVGFETKTGLAYGEEFYPDFDTIDIQFFPESGKLIENLSTKVGFKAVNVNGKGISVEGQILDINGRVLTRFKSNKLGMGCFKLQSVKRSYNYLAVLTMADGRQVNNEYLLPQVHSRGDILNITERIGVIIAANYSNHRTNETTQLKVTARGQEYFNSKVSLIDGKYIFSISKKKLPEGICVFTIYDQDELPVAERLYFNEREDRLINIETKLDQSIYSQREKVILSLNTQDDEDIGLSTNNSILVIQKDRFEYSKNNKTNILSYMLLESEIKGHIENPNLYFSDHSDLDIDNLMLTQGWRNYKYNKTLSRRKFKKETGLSVSGVVNTIKRNSKQATIELMFMIFDTKKHLLTQEIIVPGRFEFNLPDLYGDVKDFVIVPIDSEEKNKLKIAVNKKKQLPVSFDYMKKAVVLDSLVEQIITDNRSIKQAKDEFFDNLQGVTMLDEVFLEDYEMTPERKEMFDKYGKPDVVIEGEDIQEGEQDWSYGLYSVLMFSFPDKIRITRDMFRNLNAESIINSKGHVTLVVVDGVPVQKIDSALVQHMNVKEIKSVEVIDFPNNWLKLYLQVYPDARPPYPTGSIISIYTQSGLGLYGALNSKETIPVNSLKVFSPTKEFYIPKYDLEESIESDQPDLRSTIFWEPIHLTNKEGEGTMSYYHSDNTGDFKIIIESISEDGRLGYKELEYQVEPNN
jgi:hypothetical protein